MSEIKWRRHKDLHEGPFAFGRVAGRDKYYVGILADNRPGFVADVKNMNHQGWQRIDQVVGNLEEGIQLCEMWEATGVY